MGYLDEFDLHGGGIGQNHLKVMKMKLQRVK